MEHQKDVGGAQGRHAWRGKGLYYGWLIGGASFLITLLSTGFRVALTTSSNP
jgi:hypothetical protein